MDDGYTSQAALFGGNCPSTNGALASTSSPSGSAIGRLPAFSAHTRPPERRNITASRGCGQPLDVGAVEFGTLPAQFE